MFGKNFEENLLNRFDETHLSETKAFLSHYLETDDLTGRSFLDAGCGSGVFSVAAHQMGARVTAFDLDPEALQNLRTVQKRFSIEQNDIEVYQGNILDIDFLKKLGKFDLILCWGVSHHTGEMWQSIDHISQNVNPGGFIHLGIYNKADNFGFYPDGRFGSSKFWRKVKKIYSNLPAWVQNVFDFFALIGIVLIYMLTFNNPIKKLKENERRGMSWQSDMKDWLIGYPYEYATPEEVFEFMKTRGFSLTKLRTNNGLLTNNYVFKKDL